MDSRKIYSAIVRTKVHFASADGRRLRAPEGINRTRSACMIANCNDRACSVGGRRFSKGLTR